MTDNAQQELHEGDSVRLISIVSPSMFTGFFKTQRATNLNARMWDQGLRVGVVNGSIAKVKKIYDPSSTFIDIEFKGKTLNIPRACVKLQQKQ